MTELRSAGRVTVPGPWAETIRRELSAARLDDGGTVAEIKRVHDQTGLVVDPHTAVGLHAARVMRRDPSVPMVTLATADPAKFPDAVEQAIGVRPPLPPYLSELFDRRERFEVVPNDLAAIAGYLDSALAVGA
jgi:threonine synthase